MDTNFYKILILIINYLTLCACQSLPTRHIGCFKDSEDQRDLNKTTLLDNATIQGCVEECTKHYYLYAGLQSGGKCFCGSSYGRYGPGDCNSQCTSNPVEICGGPVSNTVYKTEITVPGPPSSLKVEETKETSLSISWMPPDVPFEFLHEFHIFAQLNQTFDTVSSAYSAKHVQLSSTSRSTNLIGLMPGSLYNITVAAASKDGLGPGISQFFWTEIGIPDTPDAPQLVRHEGDAKIGQIRIKIVPLDRNRKGPLTAYQVVVIDETDPVLFHQENLYNWTQAEEEGVNYWIAAELQPEWFHTNEEFVVGDGQFYGGYLNHGPLTEGRDYHITVGLVSTMNNVSKASYARVSHDQHSMENVVVFEFHSHAEDDHDHDNGGKRTKYNAEERSIETSPPSSTQSDALAIGLSVAIAIFGMMLAGGIAFYIYLRRTRSRHSGSRGDIQELTTHAATNGDIEAFANGFVTEDTEPVQLDVLRTRTWSIPRNFLELSHEVVGRGRFGSIVKGHVKRRGQHEPCNVQVVPGKILEEEEMVAMTQSLELVLRYGNHPNLIQLIGLCEDKETIFVVLEEGTLSLKQVLLDSRALIHHPAYAAKNGRFSSLPEESTLEILIGIANGMNYLVDQGILHRKLCARNIFMCNNIPKIGGIGMADYSKHGQEADLIRWQAQETFQSKNYISKCDVWSFGVLMWEVVTLGGTPYPDVKTRDVPLRVSRGLRLPQTPYMSEDMYQLMLQCWQIDVDERPQFKDLAIMFGDMAQEGILHINFSTQPGFQYEDFLHELECL